MNESENLLSSLTEECIEVAQELGKRCTKTIRFGTLEVQPGQELNNSERIRAEFADLLGVFELLVENTGFEWPSREMIDAKKAKVLKYQDYSRTTGALDQHVDGEGGVHCPASGEWIPSPTFSDVGELQQQLATSKAETAALLQDYVNQDKELVEVRRQLEVLLKIVTDEQLSGQAPPAPDAELERICAPHAHAITAYLVENRRIEIGQTWRDMSPDFARRVKKNPAGFLKVATRMVETER